MLDLGDQPAADHFPDAGDGRADQRHPLRLWLCAACGLAQLTDEPPVPRESDAVQPAALAAQARDAVAKVAAAGLIRPGARVTEFGSPHGGSWLPLLAERGLVPVTAGDALREPVDVVLDSFGLTHSADQTAAVAERAARLAEDGVLLLQYHSLATIVRNRQWNVVRHGHFGYYSIEALMGMLAIAGLRVRTTWRFDLYGGTVLLAASRTGSPDHRVRGLLAEESSSGVRDPRLVGSLNQEAERCATGLRVWLEKTVQSGKRVFGYGAAARAVVLLNHAGVDADLLPGVADAAPAKWGRRVPGTRIPVVSPDEMCASSPDVVLLFVPDLLAEVKTALPQVEAAGGEWILAR